MKKLILLFVLISSPAMADWTEVGRTRDLTVLIDLQSIQITGPGKATMWAVYENSLLQLMFGKVYKSVVVQSEHDCKTGQSRMIYKAYFNSAASMAMGEPVLENPLGGHWIPASPGSAGLVLQQSLCAEIKGRTK